jgi:hypothetical protein
MENGLEFTEAENKIRRRWLFWSTKLPAFGLGCLIAIVGVFVILAGVHAIMGLILISLLSALGFYMNYYCSYKNPGTILLLLEMIGLSLGLLPTLFKMFVFINVSIVPSLVFSPFFFFDAIVFYYSYKLRKINQNMQKRRKAMISSECVETT